MKQMYQISLFWRLGSICFKFGAWSWFSACIKIIVWSYIFHSRLPGFDKYLKMTCFILADLQWSWWQCSRCLFRTCFCANWWDVPRWRTVATFWFPHHPIGIKNSESYCTLPKLLSIFVLIWIFHVNIYNMVSKLCVQSDAKDALTTHRTLDLTSSLEVGSTTSLAAGDLSPCNNARSLLTIAFQLPFESSLQDNVATMARQYVRSVISSVQRVAMAISPSGLSPSIGPKLSQGSPEALTLATWICQSYR